MGGPHRTEINRTKPRRSEWGTRRASWPIIALFLRHCKHQACCLALPAKPPHSAVKMAEYKPQAVKDVPANEFIHAYAAHLKSTDKVGGGLTAAIFHSDGWTAAAFWAAERVWFSSKELGSIYGRVEQPTWAQDGLSTSTRTAAGITCHSAEPSPGSGSVQPDNCSIRTFSQRVCLCVG